MRDEGAKLRQKEEGGRQKAEGERALNPVLSAEGGCAYLKAKVEMRKAEET
jgi:hypothetical protein